MRASSTGPRPPGLDVAAHADPDVAPLLPGARLVGAETVVADGFQVALQGARIVAAVEDHRGTVPVEDAGIEGHLVRGR